jgi:transcriptional regulator with XRE-family HTH domain
MYEKEFGERLRILRREKGLTQSLLAERSGISTEFVSRLERGISTPSFRTICDLAQVLQVRPFSLFLFDGYGPDGAAPPKR